MISFLFTIYRFFKLLIKGIKEDREFRGVFLILLFLLLSSVVFYVKVEGWSIVDSIYFSVMTMSTVGYGDLTPTTDASKIFTVLFTVFSVGAFVTFTAKFLNIIFENSKHKSIRIKNKWNHFKKKKQK